MSDEATNDTNDTTDTPTPKPDGRRGTKPRNIKVTLNLKEHCPDVLSYLHSEYAAECATTEGKKPKWNDWVAPRAAEVLIEGFAEKAEEARQVRKTAEREAIEIEKAAIAERDEALLADGF